MIEAKELRIGNFILVDDEKDEVYSLKNGIVNGIYHPYIKPIPITVNWLQRFGFTFPKFAPEKAFIDLPNGLSLQKENNCDGFELWDEKTEECVIIKNIHNTHQLQNLYFALTGEELELKES